MWKCCTVKLGRHVSVCFVCCHQTDGKKVFFVMILSSLMSLK